MLDKESRINQYDCFCNEDGSSGLDSNIERICLCSTGRKIPFNSGRWSSDEHLKFIQGLLEYGNEWKKVQSLIKTRSSTQARSHAQKFFLRIKKNINLLDGICSPNNQDSLNDSASIKNFLELLISQDKEKPNSPSVQLSESQKLKLLNLVAKLSNNLSTQLIETNNSHAKHQIFNTKDEETSSDDSDINEELDMISPTMTISTPKKIFDIKKDKSRRESLNLASNEKRIRYNSMNVDEEPIKKGGMSLNVPFMEKNSNNITEVGTKVYDEMEVFFGRKRRSDEQLEPLIRRRLHSSCNEQIDSSSQKILFNNPDFFPKKISINGENEYEKRDNSMVIKSNPFALNFDYFCPNSSNGTDYMKENIQDTNDNDLMKGDYEEFNMI